MRQQFTLLTLLSAAVLAAAAPPGYHVIRKIHLGGEGFWDYLAADSAARRLYVSHGTHVMVLDLDTDKVVGDIPDTQGVHGIAVASDLHRGFTSNGRTNDITIFDLGTLNIIGKVPAGTNPDSIVYDPASKRVFAFNGRSGNATVIDAAAGTVLSTIPLAGKPEYTTADGAGKVYVNLEDKSQVVEIDSQKMAVTNTWPLAPCEEPSGMGIDAAHHRLFIGCHNRMMAVVDASSGKVLATPPIGPGVDGNGFDPGGGYGFSANGGDGTLTVVGETAPGRFEVVESVPTQRGARTMGVDLKTHNVYLPTAEFGPPPEATADNPRPRPTMVKDSFTLVVVGR
ncbi:MAG: YncE family protein [Bryobacteraceae bacterium]